MEKTGMIQVAGKMYVGNFKYDSVVVDEEGGKEDMLVGMENVYEVLMLPVMGQHTSGQMVVNTVLAVIKLGEMLDMPADAVVVELANDSPLYREYVHAMSGIKVESAERATRFERRKEK